MNLRQRLQTKVYDLINPRAGRDATQEFIGLAERTKAELNERINNKVYRKLAQGIFYIYGSGVKGDIVEFGTMTGRTAVVLATAINECSTKLDYSEKAHGFSEARNLYLFDSFEGLPEAQYEADKDSPQVSAGVWGGGTCKGLTPQALRHICSQHLDTSRIRIVEGWFKDTVRESLVSPLAMVHIDGDLYESAIDALNPLLERKLLSKGAIIFFDDWNCNQADPMYGEKKAWSELVANYNINYSDEGSYGVFGHSFIIHSYT